MSRKTRYGTPQRLWTAEEMAELRAMFREGYTDDQIGRHLQRGSRSVALKRYRLGLRSWASRKGANNDQFGEHRGRHRDESWKHPCGNKVRKLEGS